MLFKNSAVQGAIAASSCLAFGFCLVQSASAQTTAPAPGATSLPPIEVQARPTKRNAPKSIRTGQSSRSIARGRRNASRGRAAPPVANSNTPSQRPETAWGPVQDYVASRSAASDQDRRADHGDTAVDLGGDTQADRRPRRPDCQRRDAVHRRRSNRPLRTGRAHGLVFDPRLQSVDVGILPGRPRPAAYREPRHLLVGGALRAGARRYSEGTELGSVRPELSWRPGQPDQQEAHRGPVSRNRSPVWHLQPQAGAVRPQRSGQRRPHLALSVHRSCARQRQLCPLHAG